MAAAVKPTTSSLCLLSRSSSSVFRRNKHHSLACRAFSSTRASQADFTHAVIGGGAVGLAIARRLQSRPGASTVLIERHGLVGSETSSRNSEVIHAGLYYGPNSLKTRLCLRGKHLLYELCAKENIPHANCGKWIVAQDDAQAAEVQKVHDFASSMDIPTRWLSRDEAQRREPDVRAAAGALESTSTGIIDSHALMQHLLGDFTETRGGDIALGSAVTKVEPLGGNGRSGWRIYTNHDHAPSAAITAETLVNSAGLAAIPLSNAILPAARHRTPYYAKGSYYSYAAPAPRPRTLVYPAPTPGHAGLGTHLTLDMAGRVRFGPDVQWVDDPADVSVNTDGLAAALDDIQTYLPGLRREAVEPDYCGIRPKLGRSSAVVSSGANFADFYVVREEGFEGFVNLLGIESPGLTSCLAIAEEVEGLLYR